MKHAAPASVVMVGYHLKRARECGKDVSHHLRKALECTYAAEKDLLELEDVKFRHMEPEEGRSLIGDGISGVHKAGQAHEFFRKFIGKLGVSEPTNRQMKEIGGGGGR